ncbi:hypothetical protein WD019_00700 [Fictibacillus sp. Mic-4]|uniref:hypothetical protein n=1 Tax=Fictibacillus TaxID=1329200 RepID=UPI000420B27C|nr:hypothetical protein [Fictibacillus gelatini]
MATVLDTGSSQPNNGSASTNIPVTASPVKVAEFGLSPYVSTNKIMLSFTAGVTTTLALPTLLFKIVRDTTVIFTTRSRVEVALGQPQTISFQAVDLNVPVGNHAYFVTVELENPLLNSASIIGPISFNGVAYSL